jgi:tetratricopeptide (TPR) repeat protein
MKNAKTMNANMSSLFAQSVAKYASLASMAILLVAPALAQKPGATVQGHVNNPAGQDFTSGEAKFTTDQTVQPKDAKFSVVAPIDGSGNYKAEGVAPGDYFVYFVQGDTIADRLELKVKAEDTSLTLNDDMSRPEYLKTMKPEQLKALEEYKKKNSEVVSANKVIAQLNTTLKTVRADLTAAAPNRDDVSKDVASMKQAVDAKADSGVLWITYGDTLVAQAKHLSDADKKAGKPASSDDEVTKDFTDGIDAYKKAIALDAAAAKPNPTGLAADYNQLGNAETAIGKNDDATAAFNSAATTDPAKAGMYYKNAAAVLYNAGQMDAALDAANKAIAADPNAADAYFIKGQVLVTKSTADPKTNKMQAPAGCVEAYKKFLELAPNDPKVAQVNEVLQSLGEPIDTSYKAKKR